MDNEPQTWHVSYVYDNLEVALGEMNGWADVQRLIQGLKRPGDALTSITITRVP
jgi:hypothetical protein